SVVDAIVVDPQSCGELSLPGEYSSLNVTGKDDAPPEHEVIITSEDGSTQGVYDQVRRIGDLAHYTLTYDVSNHRDSRVTAQLIVHGQEGQGDQDTSWR